MNRIFTNVNLVLIFTIIFAIASLILTVMQDDVEWFQASGAVVTVAGVLLASRKIIRLGIEDFIKSESIIDGGDIVATPEEIEIDKQSSSDIRAYKYSIWLIIVGTLIWAYGGILLKLLNVGVNA
jgi:drug/metabolite transporter (DMT)-like permease